MEREFSIKARDEYEVISMMTGNSFLTISNMVTLGGVISGLMILLKSEVSYIDLVLLFFLLASDVFDGYIARKRKQVSLWGHFLDRILRDSIVILVFLKLLMAPLGASEELWSSLVTLLAAETFLFIFNLVNFIRHARDLEAKEEAESGIFWFLWKIKQLLYFLGSFVLVISMFF